jgi:hypothetical protein
VGFFEGAVTRGAEGNFLRGQIAKIQGEILDSSHSSAGSIGAANSRFLTRGAGNKSLELLEAEKQTKHLQDLRDRLRDLQTKLANLTANIGTAGVNNN